jgi:WD40 repeat protein
LPFSKGFFVASEAGTVALWAKAEENNKSSGKEYYDFIRKWDCKSLEGVKITAMAVNPTEEYLTMACKNNNIGLVHIKSIGLNEDTSKDVKFDLVCKGFHSGPINSMDIATQRPILATCSKDDSTIRLWNYYNNTCEMAREYYVLEDMTIREAAKPLISIAMHPSGYYMAASFIDKVRIYHILHDELRHFRNVDIKNCQQMKFSHGGQWFAAAD